MHSIDARDRADQKNKYSKDEDYLDDRVIDGIHTEIHEASAKGDYSYDYELTAGLTKKDLRYCKEKLEEEDYSVDVDYDNGIIRINW